MKLLLAFILILFSKVTLASNDDFLTYQWGIKNNGKGVDYNIKDDQVVFFPGRINADIGLYRANIKEDDSKKIKIAVIDSGIDINHPDLIDKIWINKSECEADEKYTQCLNKGFEKTYCDKNFGKLDTDGNGFPRDCHGWNFAAPIDPVTNVQGHNNMHDLIGHGTHVAGIIGASIDNNIGIRGILKNVEIIPIKINGSNETPPKEDNPTDLFAKGIEYAIKVKADIINMSWGWKYLQDSLKVRNAIKKALENNILLVAAAGNFRSEQKVYPCAYEGVICVGAHNPDDQISLFSNFGTHVDIYAPGFHILSTYPMNLPSVVFNRQTGYEYLNGSSQAAPFISGVLGLLLNQGYSPKEAKNKILIQTRVGQIDNYLFSNIPIIDLEILKTKNETKSIIKLKTKDLIYTDINKEQSIINIDLISINSNEIINSISLNRLENSLLGQNDIEATILNENELLGPWKSNQDKTLKIKIEIINKESAESSIPFKLILGSKNNNSEIIFNLNLINDLETIVSNPNRNINNNLNYVPFEIKIPNIQTSTFHYPRNLFSNKTQPQFINIVENNGASFISLIKKEENHYITYRPLKIEDDSLILINATIIDIDQNGFENYFIYLLKREPYTDQVTNEIRNKFYSYFILTDHNFSRLDSDIFPKEKMENTATILGGDLNFIYNSKKNLFVPYWISNGKVPDEFFKTSKWDDLKEHNTFSPKFYSFSNQKLNVFNLNKNQTPIHFFIQTFENIKNKESYLITKDEESQSGNYNFSKINSKTLKIDIIKSFSLDTPVFLEEAKFIPLKKSNSQTAMGFANIALDGEFYITSLFPSIDYKNIIHDQVYLKDKRPLQDIITIQNNDNGLIESVLYQTDLFYGQLIKANQIGNEILKNEKYFTNVSLKFINMFNSDKVLIKRESSKDYSNNFLSFYTEKNGVKKIFIKAVDKIKNPKNCFEISENHGFWGHLDTLFLLCPEKNQIIELNSVK